MTTPREAAPGPVNGDPFPIDDETPAAGGRFFREAAKLAVAFAIGAVAAVLVMSGFGRTAGSRPAPVVKQSVLPPAAAGADDSKFAPLRERKQWPAMNVAAKSKATLWTKLQDGTMLYRLLVEEVPEAGFAFSPDARLGVKLLDADGFAIAEVSLDPSDTTRHNTPDGKVASYEWLGGAAISPETYALVRAWSVSLTGFSDAVPAPDALPAANAATGTAPAPPPVVLEPAPMSAAAARSAVERRWQNPANWRKVSVGMTPQQVLLLLGVPSKKDNASPGMETWYYGDLENGGNVFFLKIDKDVSVKSFSAPRR